MEHYNIISCVPCESPCVPRGKEMQYINHKGHEGYTKDTKKGIIPCVPRVNPCVLSGKKSSILTTKGTKNNNI